MPDEQYQQFMLEVTKIHQRMTDHYGQEEKFKDEIRAKLNPMYELFTDVKSFNNVTRALVKAVILFGAGVGVLYGLLRWIKQ